jgi:hypothetical protein
MRNSGLFLLLLFLLLLSCRDDFDLEAPYADIPVIFAFLETQEDENFVRVQKAFQGINGNAEASVSSIDSLYYNEEEVSVTISRQDETPVSMERVDGADFGIVRDSGAFVNTPNWLYRVPEDFNLSPQSEITINVDRPGEAPASATTTMIGPLNMSFPVSGQSIRFQNYQTSTNIRWNATDAARIFSVKFLINIREVDVSNPGGATNRILEWELADSYERESDQSIVVFEFNNEAFWQFLSISLEPNPSLIRQFVDFDIEVTGVGAEIEAALDLSAANAGITGSTAIPVYTNVVNGLGIVSSRSFGRSSGILLDAANMDTLQNGIYTGDLGF